MILRRLFVPLRALALVLGVLVAYPRPAAPSAEAGCLSADERREEKIRFFVLGDWGRSGEWTQRAVAEQMGKAAEKGVDFVISAGDNFYENGVDGVDDPAWAESYRDIYTSLCLDVPWYPVLGNHDYRGSTKAQIEYSGRDSRWTMPDRYYSLVKELGGEEVLFVFLDTSPFVGKYRWARWRYPDLPAQDAAVQLAWLEEVLAGSEARWKIVTGHHPVFSGGRMHGPTRELRSELAPIFEKYGVNVYFSGHEHNLQHLRPAGATHYVISGGGSGGRRAGSTADTLYAAEAAGFAAATLTAGELRLEFIDAAGSVVYKTIIPGN
jgi:tartrate-resistant acid phosphatase type 5